MEFTNEFRVPADAATTFATLVDLERVAPCMPGAVLEEVDGDTYSGRMKVKVGPIQMSYRGTAKVTEADEDAGRARISASGKEERGSGTASADVTATLRDEEGETVVTVLTDINVTGKPAQFGRGVMADVGAKIIGQFADRLEKMLQEGDPAPPAPEPARGEAAATGAAAAGGDATDAEADAPSDGEATPAVAATGPRRIEQDPGREDDALDLVSVARGAAFKRLVPLVVGVALVVAVIWWLRGR